MNNRRGPYEVTEDFVAKVSQLKVTLGFRGYFFLIDTDGSRQSRVNEEKITSGHRSTQPHFHVRNHFRI